MFSELAMMYYLDDSFEFVKYRSIEMLILSSVLPISRVVLAIYLLDIALS